MDFLEIMVEDYIVCGICAKVCPTGALELRQEEKTLNGMSYICEAMKPTISNENYIYCGLCEGICPRACIEVIRDISKERSWS
jgi:4Fe-4S ferredoxin